MVYLVSLDIGTSSVRAILFDKKYQTVKEFQREVKIFSPQDGFVEQDPEELWFKSKEVLEDAITFAKKQRGEIKGLGLTNQRETTILWRRSTGVPLYPAIVWQDRRTGEYCQKISRNGWFEKIYKKTGLRVDSYFSATKIVWILNNSKEARGAMKNKDFLFGTVDSWVIWKLTEGREHLTDVSNAGRTMLFNIKNKKWDDDLLKMFNIPLEILPKVKPSFSKQENFGSVKIAGKEFPILSVCGDQSSALYGQECWKQGQAKATYGTGGFLVVNAGENCKLGNPMLLTSIAWQEEKKTTYMLEGSIFQSGGTLKWLRDNLNLFDNYEEANKEGEKVGDSGGVFFVPSFVGLGAPFWCSKAKGIIVGLTNKTKKAHLIKATIESAAFQVNNLLELLKCQYRLTIKKIKIDGGLVQNPYLPQFQADISKVEVIKSLEQEMTALGVALMAGKVLGWSTKKENKYQIYKPRFLKNRNLLLDGWQRAIKKSFDF